MGFMIEKIVKICLQFKSTQVQEITVRKFARGDQVLMINTWNNLPDDTVGGCGNNYDFRKEAR